MYPLDDDFRKKFQEMYPRIADDTFNLTPGDFVNLNPPMQFPLHNVKKGEEKAEPKMPENLKAWLQQFEPPVERRQKYFLEGIDEGRYHIGPDPLLLHPVQRAEVTGMRRAGIDLTAGHELDALAVAEGVALLLGTRVERAG